MICDRTDVIFFGFCALVITLQSVWGTGFLANLVVLPSIN